jgi:hypothetical protein
MKSFFKIAATIAILAAAVAFCAPGPNASSEHFVVVNDNNLYAIGSHGDDYATLLKLEGAKQNSLLKQTAMLDSGEPSAGQIFAATPTVQIVRIGADVCLFMADSDGPASDTPNEITSFKYPSMTPVGSFSDSNVSSSEAGIVIVADGNYLFAAYDGYHAGSYMATWQIEPGCTLALLGTYPISDEDVINMAVTPDGKTLVASESSSYACCEDSFSVGAGGALTEHGPYYLSNALFSSGLDITADSKFAVVNVESFTGYTEVNVFAIDPNGSLGTQYTFGGDGSLGKAAAGYYVWLSPDERFLFVDGSTGTVPQVTTLNFSESPIDITYIGCITTLKIPIGADALYANSMATVGTSGTGVGLYVADMGLAEGYYVPAVALLTIDPTTGCTTETRNSPAIISDPYAYLTSLVAWPPRPF